MHRHRGIQLLAGCGLNQTATLQEHQNDASPSGHSAVGLDVGRTK